MRMQTAKLALSGNADLRNDEDAMKEVSMKMQRTLAKHMKMLHKRHGRTRPELFFLLSR